MVWVLTGIKHHLTGIKRSNANNVNINRGKSKAWLLTGIKSTTVLAVETMPTISVLMLSMSMLTEASQRCC